MTTHLSFQPMRFWMALACLNIATAGKIAAQAPLTPQVCTAPAQQDMTGAAQFGNGTPGSITQAALQTLIDAGGKIVFNGGAAPVTLTLTATLLVDARKEVIIDGLGLLTISGNNAVRIFDKGAPSDNPAEWTLFAVQNMRLINGRTNQGLGGAAIRGNFYGTLKVHNVAFADNQGPLSNGDACGAVWTGGYREASFVNCTFVNNKAANGGAIGSIGSGVTIINCLFDGNQAVGTGGTFGQGGQGGAVYMDGVQADGVPANGGTNRLNLCGSTFKNSTAGHQAGALNASFYRNQGSTGTIDRCTFDNNNCTPAQGGAMYLQLSEGLPTTGSNGSFAVTNCSFNNNSTPSQGGAAWVGPNTITAFTNCTFNNNRAVDGGNGLGGGLAFTEFTNNTITNCTFAYNRAGNFASAIFNGGSLTLTNTLFYENLVGIASQANADAGAVINKGSSLTVGSGNLQFPAGFTSQFGTVARDYWLTNNVLTTDAQLQNLADNGGPTPTMALPAGSPAINAGVAGGAPATDQRGTARTGNPDIGAFEFGGAPPVNTPVLTANPTALAGFSADLNTPSAPQSYTLTGSNLGAESITATAPASYEISENGTSFTTALILAPDAGGALAKTVQVRLTGAGTGNIGGAITHFSATRTFPSVSVSGTIVPLPVRLISFRAVASGERVALNWETSFERNASHFSIERSSDGRVFETVGRVSATGDTQVQQTYRFTDASPLSGTAYYRLLMVDRDSKSEYSPVAAATLGETAPTMTLLGNPVAGSLIRLAVRNMAGASYRLCSLTGQSIRIQAEAQTEWSVDLRLQQSLPAGMYLLEGQVGNHRKTLKVMVNQ